MPAHYRPSTAFERAGAGADDTKPSAASSCARPTYKLTARNGVTRFRLADGALAEGLAPPRMTTATTTAKKAALLAAVAALAFAAGLASGLAGYKTGVLAITLWSGFTDTVGGWAAGLVGGLQQMHTAAAGRVGGGVPFTAGPTQATAAAAAAWSAAAYDTAAQTCMATCMAGAVDAAAAPSSAAAGAAMQSAVLRAAGFEAAVGRGADFNTAFSVVCPFKVVAGAVRAAASIHGRAAVKAAASAWVDGSALAQHAAATAGPAALEVARAATTIAVAAWDVAEPVARAAASAVAAAGHALGSAARAVVLTVLEPPGSVPFELEAVRARWPADGEHAGTDIGAYVDRLIREELAKRALRRAVVSEVAALCAIVAVGAAVIAFTHALERRRPWVWRLDTAVRARLRLAQVKHPRAHALLRKSAGAWLCDGKVWGLLIMSTVVFWCSTGLLAHAPPPPPCAARMTRVAG